MFMSVKSAISPESKYHHALRIITATLLILLAAWVTITFLYPYIGPDGGFYLKIAYDIAMGISFFGQMNAAYTPMGMYLMAVLFAFIPDAGFTLIMGYYVLFYAAIAFLFYKILAMHNLEKALTHLLVAILLLSFYLFQGSNIYLEPFVLVFQLLALLLLLKWECKKVWYLMFLAGASSFFAFFSKQYGLFIIPAFIFLQYRNSTTIKEFIRHLTVFGIGFLFPLTFFYVYTSIFTTLSFYEFASKILGINYLTGEEKITGINYHPQKFFEQVFNFFIKAPYTLVIIFALFLKKIRFLTGNTIFYLLIIAGGCLQLIFAAYYHYFQLIFPYCLLLTASILHEQNKENKPVLKQAIIITGFIFIITSSYWFAKDYRHIYKKHNEQEINKAIIQKILPTREKVFLQGISPSYYFVCKFDSPNHMELGYRFPEELTLKRIDKYLPTGTYIIIKPKLLEHKPFNKGYKFINRVNLHGGKSCIICLKE